MKRGQPLTLEEIKELSDKWFPLFDEVHSRLPDWASVEDTLKVWSTSPNSLVQRSQLRNERTVSSFTTVVLAGLKINW